MNSESGKAMRGGAVTIGRVRRLHRDMTEAERLLWQGLRQDRLGWRFRRQHPIPPYIADFACVEARLVVEADGGQHNRDGEHNLRDRRLIDAGWRVLRFWNDDILQNRAGVLETIAAALAAAPTPTLPRARRRE